MLNIKMKSTPKIRRLTLRGWAAIDDLGRSIESVSQNKEWNKIPELMFKTIELCVDGFDREMFWADVAELYNQVVSVNHPTKIFPILASKTKATPLPWEYDGRSWYFWLNVLGKKYGWDAEKIASLDIDDAIGLYQEIEFDDQIEKEWQYGLSEISYEYDKNTKTSKFRPLPRPDWMSKKQEPIRASLAGIQKIPSKMMPVGLIVDVSDPEYRKRV